MRYAESEDGVFAFARERESLPSRGEPDADTPTIVHHPPTPP